MERPRCQMTGCKNVAEISRKITYEDGTQKIYYKKECTSHIRIKRGLTSTGKPPRKNICAFCGWNGPCDWHRKLSGANGGTYKYENIIEICPNCHRLQHTQK